MGESGPHVSLGNGIKPGAPLPHISKRWNPDHKHEMSGELYQIPKDHSEPKQHSRSRRAPQQQYVTSRVYQEWQYQSQGSIQTQVCIQINTPSTARAMKTDMAEYANESLGNSQ